MWCPAVKCLSQGCDNLATGGGAYCERCFEELLYGEPAGEVNPWVAGAVLVVLFIGIVAAFSFLKR